jgi:CheY-like chemotaxis protein
MDGWELLNRLRANPATARIPIAMMAGVLDTVDPGKLASAPIQGFLKKPIELRDLPDRVRQLLGTPVSSTGAFPIPEPAAPPAPVEMPEFVPTQRDIPEPSPYATQPPGTRLPDFDAPEAFLDPSELETVPAGTKLSDLTGVPDPGDLITLPPGTKLTDLPGIAPEPPPPPVPAMPALELDLLLLTPEDLLDEPAAEPAMPELDLEELDLDSLRGLAPEPGADASTGAAIEAAPAAALEAAAEPEFAFDLADLPASAAAPVAEPPSAPDLEVDAPLDMDLLADLAPAPQDTGPTWDEVPSLPDETAPPAAFPLDLPHPEPAEGFQVITGEVHDRYQAEPEPQPEPGPVPESEPAPTVSPFSSTQELPPIQTLDLDAGSLPPLSAWPEAEPAEADSAPMAAALAGGAAFAGGAALLGGLAAPAPAPAEAPSPAAALASGDEADRLLAALLANPAALDALSRAVVARLGDQTLREIAWEIMPELAEKLHRPS